MLSKLNVMFAHPLSINVWFNSFNNSFINNLKTSDSFSILTLHCALHKHEQVNKDKETSKHC